MQGSSTIIIHFSYVIRMRTCLSALIRHHLRYNYISVHDRVCIGVIKTKIRLAAPLENCLISAAKGVNDVFMYYTVAIYGHLKPIINGYNLITT